MNVKEAAIKWGVTDAMASYYCRKGRCGAVRGGVVSWVIPDDAPRPEPLKRGRVFGWRKADKKEVDNV